MTKVGLILGEFDPLHNGHVDLIREAQREMDEVWVLVHGHASNFSLDMRSNWIRHEFPEVNVECFHLIKTVEVAVMSLSYYHDKKVTHYYHSGTALEDVPSTILIRPYDIFRKRNPIKSTDIRKDLEGNKDSLPEFVYEDIKRLKIS